MEKKNADLEAGAEVEIEAEARAVHRTLSFGLSTTQTPVTPAESVALSTPSLLHTPTPSIEF